MPKIYDKMTAAYGQAGVDRKVADASQIFDEEAGRFQNAINASAAEVIVIPYGSNPQTDEEELRISTDEFRALAEKYDRNRHVVFIGHIDNGAFSSLIPAEFYVRKIGGVVFHAYAKAWVVDDDISNVTSLSIQEISYNKDDDELSWRRDYRQLPVVVNDFGGSTSVVVSQWAVSRRFDNLEKRRRIRATLTFAVGGNNSVALDSSAYEIQTIVADLEDADMSGDVQLVLSYSPAIVGTMPEHIRLSSIQVDKRDSTSITKMLFSGLQGSFLVILSAESGVVSATIEIATS